MKILFLVAASLRQPIPSSEKSKSSGAWRCSTNSRLISLVKHANPYLSHSPFLHILSLILFPSREFLSTRRRRRCRPSFLPLSLSLSTMATMMASTTVTVGSHVAAGRPPLGRPVARCGDTLHNSEAGGQIQPVLWGGGGCAARMRSTSGRLPLSSLWCGAPPGFSLEHDCDQASTSSTGCGHTFVVCCCNPEPHT
jgi:hypothetical protein